MLCPCSGGKIDFGYFLLLTKNLCKMSATERLIAEKWTHQPQEQDGDYWFDGQIFMTNNIQADIPEKELIALISYIQKLAIDSKGIDYLQVFTNDEGDKIYIIDQITRKQVPKSPKEYHHCTILFDHEY